MKKAEFIEILKKCGVSEKTTVVMGFEDYQQPQPYVWVTTRAEKGMRTLETLVGKQCMQHFTPRTWKIEVEALEKLEV